MDERSHLINEKGESSSPKSCKKTVWFGVVFGLIQLVILILLVVTLHHSVKNHDSLNAVSTNVDTVASLTHSILTKVNSIDTTVSFPDKFSPAFVPPVTFQENRGTCWDFATVNYLAWSYRNSGIAKKYLKDTEYVHFSEQSFGISMMKHCEEDEVLCTEIGDEVSNNSTEGGEIGWLYYVTKPYSELLPVSVCPYVPTPGNANEHACPGREKYMKKNPIKYDIKKMETAYNVLDTKKLMVEHNSILGWSSNVHMVAYYIPCVGDWSTTDSCSADKRVKCPLGSNTYYGDIEYCARLITPMWNMNGEFYVHDEIMVEGGHAMNVVGFNDNFQTTLGDKGIFIIKNSWHDKVYNPPQYPRGSHSIQYWMQNISDWDEKTICPNAGNPVNWMSCISIASGPTMSRILTPTASAVGAAEADVDMGVCLDDDTTLKIAKVARQPLEFECGEKNTLPVCKEANTRFFLDEAVRSPAGDLMQVCMRAYDTVAKTATRVCTPYTIPDWIAYQFRPTERYRKLLVNDEDNCGYYAFPYSVLDQQVAQTGGYYATYFDIEWDESSYLANQHKYPHLNAGVYGLLKSSTHNQTVREFSGPYPFNDHRI